jgi:beta-phosphoglucomutase
VASAYIFDLDGVIVDTAKYHFRAWKRLAFELGIEFTESDNERLKGVSRVRSLEIILELGGIELSEAEKQKCADRKNGWFVDYVNAMTPNEIFAGAKELIVSLRENGIKIALASSSKNARSIVDHLGITNLFDVIVDGTMIVNSKPDPEIFLLAAGRLNTNPNDCLVFEDAAAGVAAAHAAGMKCIGVGDESILTQADMIVRTVGDFKLGNITALKDERVS